MIDRKTVLKKDKTSHAAQRLCIALIGTDLCICRWPQRIVSRQSSRLLEAKHTYKLDYEVKPSARQIMFISSLMATKPLSPMS